jgi:hypothetical protein
MMKCKRQILSILTLALVAGGIAYWYLSAEPPISAEDIADAAVAANITPSATNPSDEGKEESPEEKQRRQLLGVWKDKHMGTNRTMILKEDGSGTIFVEASGLQAIPFGPKLRFDMKWSFDGKKLFTKTLAGEPADQVERVLSIYGNTSDDTILEHTDDRLRLLDRDGSREYDWRRVPKAETR